MTPVRVSSDPTDVRANRAAPERSSAAVVHWWHRAVVDADVAHEAAVAASYWRSSEPGSEADANSGHVWRTLVGGIFAALDRLAVRAGHVGRLGALLAGDNIELDLFAVADAAQVLAWVVARDRCLVHEHVLLGVVAVDESVAVLHVKPLHRTHDVRQDDLHAIISGLNY